ncbi:PREDICTED: uncharacterized protein LOC108362449 [Rhagoletis zephyria]|uniref:uncharacterized protein LOC108362449 n=1 Tax=Rhagoletis zephyria TaxID=28612 RepID=UPI0008113E03|nr:PREDICTED: uncharacterized protein LOC108362449 [Rhagoletis zephyria]
MEYKWITQNQCIRILPVSTRAIGLNIRILAADLSRLDIFPGVEDFSDRIYKLTNALYRISLLQFDLKLAGAMEGQHSKNFDNHGFEDIFVPESYRHALEGMGAGFAPLIKILSGIGFFKKGGMSFLPKHPRLLKGSCSPIYVRFSNLRYVVTQLSRNSRNQNPIRRKFYKYNPIPGARWDFSTTKTHSVRGRKLNPAPVLENPNDIMPDNYSINLLRDDIALVADCIEKIGSKYPQYISSRGIDFKANGLISQIVSTSIAELRCPTYPTTGKPETIVTEYHPFWAPIILSDEEFCLGIWYLMGETGDDKKSLVAPWNNNLRSYEAGIAEEHDEYVSEFHPGFFNFLMTT